MNRIDAHMPWNISRTYIFLLCFIIAGTVIRFALLPTTFWYGDTARDLLVPQHILQYHEIPHIGHLASGTEPMTHYPPLYFYILAFLMLPSQNFWYITSIMVLCNIATIGIVYVLTKRLSDTISACIATCFYTFSAFILQNQISITAYHLSVPFFLFGTYFHLVGIQKRLLLPTLTGFFLLAISASMNYAIIILIPIYLAWTIYYFWKKPHEIIYTICFIYFMYIFIYYDYVKFMINQSGFMTFAAPLLPNNNIISTNIFLSLLQQYQMYIQNIFPQLPLMLFESVILYIGLNAIYSHRKAISFLYPLSFILVTLVLSAVRAKPMVNYYYYPITPFLFILFGISYAKQKPTFVAVTSGVLLLMFAWFAIRPSVSFFSFSHSYQKTEASAMAIIEALQTVQKNENYTDMKFFRLRTINSGGHEWQMSSYAYFLEHSLGKLLQVEDRYHNLRWIGSEKYLVIVCLLDKTTTVKWCKNRVTHLYPHATYIDEILNPLNAPTYLYRNVP